MKSIYDLGRTQVPPVLQIVAQHGRADRLSPDLRLVNMRKTGHNHHNKDASDTHETVKYMSASVGVLVRLSLVLV